MTQTPGSPSSAPAPDDAFLSDAFLSDADLDEILEESDALRAATATTATAAD
ncbi:hypothetical protein [Streptacidiphilus anmyonensis]|uniref:hypothetical protein n=1 Tax=Streptacidiphilus anmyonensis TaxID=405782 RepID=UPI000B2D830C|nr:hypothetical protein [Streptacidiphilus anmyonensis]